MERNYNVTLKLNYPISLEAFDDGIEKYVNSTGIFNREKTRKLGYNVVTETEDGDKVIFGLNGVSFEFREPLEELDALKFALRMAGEIESVVPQFDPSLTFNPDYVYLFVGGDLKGNSMEVGEFISCALELQERLYHGGNIAYSESSGDFGFHLGTQEIDFNPGTRHVVVEAEEKAQPPGSLDVLLARLSQ